MQPLSTINVQEKEKGRKQVETKSHQTTEKLQQVVNICSKFFPHFKKGQHGL